MTWLEAVRTLGIDSGCSVDPTALKSAYRAIAKKTHPDQGGSDVLFRQCRNAYEYLKEHPHRPHRSAAAPAAPASRPKSPTVQPDIPYALQDERMSSGRVLNVAEELKGTGRVHAIAAAKRRKDLWTDWFPVVHAIETDEGISCMTAFCFAKADYVRYSSNTRSVQDGSCTLHLFGTKT